MRWHGDQSNQSSSSRKRRGTPATLNEVDGDDDGSHFEEIIIKEAIASGKLHSPLSHFLPCSPRLSSFRNHVLFRCILVAKLKWSDSGKLMVLSQGMLGFIDIVSMPPLMLTIITSPLLTSLEKCCLCGTRKDKKSFSSRSPDACWT